MRISRILAANQCECKSFSTNFGIRMERPGRRRFSSSAPSAGAASFPRRRPDFPAAVRPAKTRPETAAESGGRRREKPERPGRRPVLPPTSPVDRPARRPRPSRERRDVRRGRKDGPHGAAPPRKARRDRAVGERLSIRSRPNRRSAPGASRRFSWRRISRRERGRNPRRNRPAPFPPPRSSAEDRRDTPRNRRSSGFPDAKGR